MSLELASTCRTCLDEDSRYYQLEDYVDEHHTILEMLHEVLPQIKIKDESGIEFSSLICETCVDKLVTSFMFQRLCIDTDSRLRQMLLHPVEEVVVEQQSDCDEPLLEEESLQEHIEIEIKNECDDDEVDDDDDDYDYENYDFDEDRIAEIDGEEFGEDEERNDISGEENYIQEEDEDWKDSDGEEEEENLLPEMTNDEKEAKDSLKPPETKTEQEILEEKASKLSIPFQIIKIHEYKRFTCTECEKIYDRISRVEQHMNKKHKFSLKDVKLYIRYVESKLNETNIENYTESPYKTKRTSFGSNRHFPCEICGKVFDGYTRLQRHEASVHSTDKPHICNICLRGCASQDSLRRHQKVHFKKEDDDTGEGLKCPYCSKRFTSKNELAAHRLTHASNCKFVCKICKRKYMTLRTLCDHIKRTHPNKTFPCKQCDRKFPLKEQLSRHMHSHRKVELYCSICEKEFTSELAVKEHMYIHTGENPYLCPKCGKGFKYSSSLRKHIARHSDQLIFECPFCERKFKCREDVNAHKKLHLNDKPFKCCKCGIRFTKRYHLRRHRKLICT
uniref:Protein krueppel n=1 Tax=Stomoxys calcitrans TaxID=35570 RepID=A0A1I8Q060_STOCA